MNSIVKDNVCYDMIIRLFMILSIFIITLVKSNTIMTNKNYNVTMQDPN